MKVLEQELRRELFVRQGRQIAVSDAGRQLIPGAEALLKQAEALRQGEDPKPDDTLRLASFEVFTTHLLGPLVAEVLGPRALEVRETIPGEIEQAVLSRTADYGLTYTPIPTAGLEFAKVGAISMGIFGRAAAFGHTPFHELPFVVPLAPAAATPTKARGLDGWPDDRIARRAPYRVSLMETALELCRQGLAVAWLPRFVVRLHNKKVETKWRLGEIAKAPFKEERAGLWVITRKGAGDTRELRALTRALRGLCRD
jgi:DNA-binding transcriptional LysR family regulator